jgi:hypothetical protein
LIVYEFDKATGTGTVVLTGANPFKIDPEQDLLSEPGTKREWSESYFFQVWSPDPGVGVYVHTGVLPDDHALWYAQVFVYLPDGVLICDRSFGRASDRSGPSTGNFSARCIEPLRRWRIEFDGAGERTTSATAAGLVIGDRDVVPARFSIELTAAAPIWDLFGALNLPELDFGGRHTQQAYVASGELWVAGQRWNVDGIGYNDHSNGARNFDSDGYGGDHIFFAVAPPGRVAQGIAVWDRKGRAVLNAGYLVEGSEMELLVSSEVPGLVDYTGQPTTGKVSLTSGDGRVSMFDIEVLHTSPFTISGPNDYINGVVTDEEHDEPVAVICPIRCTWPDGVVGYGELERVYRPSLLGQMPRPAAGA